MAALTNDHGTDIVATETLPTDPWSMGGSEALQTYAPAAAQSLARLVGVRPAGVFDEVLTAPAVTAMADQFRADVSGVDERLRNDFASATGERQLEVAQMVWIADASARLRAALDAVFGPSEWKAERRYPVADVGGVVEQFAASVARLDAVDPTATELVRLRVARQHHSRIGSSRRSVAAIEAGASDATFAAVDDHAASTLPASSKAALALADAIIRTPEDIGSAVVDAVRAELSPALAVEVVLDVIRHAADKVAVALGADAAEVTEGVQLFVTDADGVVTTV